MSLKPEQITEEVFKIYQRYGIKSVTMDDVSRHLGISKKTLYQYFTDKEDLVRQALQLEYTRWFVRLKEPESLGLNAIEEIFEVYKVLKRMYRHANPSMEYDLRKYYPALSKEFTEKRRKEIYGSGYRNLVKGKNQGFYRKDLNPKIIAGLHVLKVENMAAEDLFRISHDLSSRIIHEIFIYHLQGIMSPEGRQFFNGNKLNFREPRES